MKYMTAYMREYRTWHREGTGPLVACACGCGATFRERDGYNGRPRRYIKGHNKRDDKRGCFTSEAQPHRKPQNDRPANDTQG